jgi:hypothetical protein
VEPSSLPDGDKYHGASGHIALMGHINELKFEPQGIVALDA